MELPVEIWETIAAYIQPNPITYTRLGMVCSTAHTVFTSDRLWRALTPVKSESNLAQSFLERLNDANESTRTQIHNLWNQVDTFDYWNFDYNLGEVDITDSPDLALVFTVLAATKMFKDRDDFGDFDLSDFEDFEDDEDSSEEPDQNQHQPNNTGAPRPLSLPTHLFTTEFVTAAVTLWGPVLAHAPKFQDNENVVWNAVSTRHSLHWTAPETDGHALRFAPKLQNNTRIITEAIVGDGLSFEFASPDLQKDPQFVKSIGKINGSILAFASKNIRGNKEVVLDSIKGSGLGLAYASHEIKSDRDIVLTAVNIRGASLRDAVPRLKIDKEIIDAAVANDPFAEKYIPEDIDELREVLGVAYLPPKEPRPLI